MADEVQIDSLSVAIEQSANDSSDSLARLSKNLRELKSVTSGLRLTNTVNGLHGIADATSKLKLTKIAELGMLGNAMNKIAGAGKISSSFAKQITEIGVAINGLEHVDSARLRGLADALSPLAALDRSKLTSYINQLKQLPEVADALDGMDMDRFAASIRRAADAMKPLADEMEKVSNGFSALPTKIQRIIRENERMTASTKRGATGWKALRSAVRDSLFGHSVVRELLGITSATTVFFKVANKAIYALKSATDYTENLNLFSVAMGEYAEEAYDYAKEVESVLGIDDKEWIRHQGTLMDMARGYGVASDAAYTMSKALTQLTYDFMSFYNIESFSESANKMRSALAGEIEPIRALGKDLSVARLQLTATKLGIDENVDAMTQAGKAVLRTIVLLDRSGTASGDLARTLDDPANQFRILNAQMTLFARSVGDLMLPLVKEVLPYLTATFRVMRMITKEFARLAGIELPDINTEVSTEQTESLGEALGEAADEAKRLFQLSFDELNILGSQAGAGSNDSMDKLVEEMERLAAIQDAAFMKDVEDSVAGITEDMVDWLTKGEGIEKWTKGVYDNVIGVKDAFEDIVKKIGLWDEEGSTKEKLQKVADIIKGIATSVLIIKGIGLVKSIINAVTGDGALATILGKIFGNTEKVADAFDNKNKKLEKQTEDTVADTAAVTDLAGELAGATKKTDDASDALNIMGGVALWLAGLLTDNPLTPVVDSSDATAAFEELVEQAGVSMGQVVAIVDDQGKTVAEKEAAASDLFVQAGKDGWDELVRLASEYGVTIVEKTTETGDAIVEQAQVSGAEYSGTIETAFTNAEESVKDSLSRTETGVTGAFSTIDQETVDFSNAVTGTVSDLGENMYNGLTTPVEEAAHEIGITFETIADDFKELQDYLRSEATVSFKAGSSTVSIPSYVAPSSQMLDSVYAPKDSSDYQWNKVWRDDIADSKGMSAKEAAINESAKAAADETAKDFFKYAQTIDKNPELTSKLTTGTNVIKNIIDNSLDALKWLFGGTSLSFGIPAFASGGIVEDGLFMANSTELVGRFANGRTAVANNQQITDGIANGVREANHELIGVIYATAQQIVQAVNEGSVLYLDGERVTKKVTNAQNRANRMHGTTMQNV